MDFSFSEWIKVGLFVALMGGIVALSIAMALLAIRFRKKRRAVRGARSQARVVAIDVHLKGCLRRVDSILLTYEFPTGDGQRVRDRVELCFVSFEGARKYAATHPAGSSLTVWFDPNDPRKHLVLTRRLVANLRVGAALLLPGGVVLKFARFWVIASLALFVGVSLDLLIVRPYHDVRIALTFLETRCEVVVKRHKGWRAEFEFARPVFDLAYEVDGRTVNSSGFDDRGAYSGFRGERSVDRVLANFDIDASYPCWYDPAEPPRVVLVKRKSFVLPLAFAVMAGLLGFAVRLPERSVARAVMGALGLNVLAVLLGYEIVEDWWRGWPSYPLVAGIGLLGAAAIAMTAYAAWRVFRGSPRNG